MNRWLTGSDHRTYDRRRRRLSVLTSIAPVLLLLGCGPSTPAGALAKPPEFAPEGQTKCSVSKSQSRPLIVEWPASDRAALESQAQRGRVVVRYSGCELEVLRRCRAPGNYGYTPLTPKHETVAMRDADELYANIPVYAAKFEGTLERAGQLNVSMTIVGMYESFEPLPSESQLEGDCERATHVIHALTVGAFEFYAGAEAGVSAGAGLLGASVGGKSSASRESLSRDGTDQACQAATKRDNEPPDGCGGLLRLEVVPIERGTAQASLAPARAKSAPAKAQAPATAATAAPTCGPGEQWSDGRCQAKPQRAKSATLAPQDVGFRDTHGGAGWGNRCFKHVKARELSYARAACQQGLDLQPTPAIRGAILYSMATIEELDEDQPAACRWLRESLRVRPGNAPTLAKTDKLGCEP